MKIGIRNMIVILVAGTLAVSSAGCGVHTQQSGNGVKITSAESTETTENPSESIRKNQLEGDAKAAADHLLTLWSDYLGVLDRMYESELWAFDYVEAYLDSGDWSDLTKARTACIASARYLTELSMSEADLSEDEYLALANAGVDTGYQATEFASLEGTLKEAHSFVRNRLLESLEYDVFFQSSIEILKKELAVQRDYISCMGRYICNETNYLLLSLGDEAVSDSYWSSVEENYPTLVSGGTTWIGNENEVKAAADLCLDEYEDIILKQSDLLSDMNADLYRMTELVENSDLEGIKASAHVMTNVPPLLPMPGWYKPESAGYLSFVAGEDGSVTYPESGDTLSDEDYGMYIQVKGIQEADIDAYMDLAEGYGDHCWKGEDGIAWYISMPGYNVKIDWKDDTATLLFNGEDVTFAPGWYIGLQQSNSENNFN